MGNKVPWKIGMLIYLLATSRPLISLQKEAVFDREVLQSRFGVNFLFLSGEFKENCRRISQRILMANFLREFFGLVFSRASGPPKNSCPKFTARIVRIPLQFHFLEPNTFSRRFSASGGDQQFYHLVTSRPPI